MQQNIVMTEGDRERVGDIMRVRSLAQTKGLLYHPLHLFLAGSPVSGERILNSCGRVTYHGNPVPGGGGTDDAAGMSHQDCRSRMSVFAIEFLNDDDRGSEFAKDLGHAPVNFKKPFFKRVFIETAEHSRLYERWFPG
jgi:hypothetical protein